MVSGSIALVYLVGPLLLAWALHRRAGAAARTFFAGVVAFGASQVAMVVLLFGLGCAAAVLARSWIDVAIVVGGWLAAGLCEEICRAWGLRWVARKSSLTTSESAMNAVGHSGLETWMVGAMFIGIAGLRAMPEADLPEPLVDWLASNEDAGLVMGLVFALHRLCFGLLIHGTYTAFVVRSIHRGSRRWLLLAMLLHAANNAMATTFQESLTEPAFLGVYSVGLVVVYGGLLRWLWQTRGS